ncbi:MAG: 16S rRNA (cytosine(1402)-N(4))-methyltransferase RsmH [Candidatus Levybacteria bacterium]|nr:16S rRNA (cytosine(1402)-N(4))-methyltransferase RsmH [Candidatus Levybacteria bacterium]
MNNFHTPVLLQEVLEFLRIEKGKKYIDATIGGGGHSFEILKRGGIVLGIDCDEEAIEYINEKIKNQKSKIKYWERLALAQGNFRDIGEIARSNHFEQVSGILFDLGVSSHQLEDAKRGFSFQKEGPLDMRMNHKLSVKAADLINGLTKGELYELFSKLAEEPRALAISESIIRARRISPIKTTSELVMAISKVKSLARVFQALRIAVNDELNNLRSALPQAVSLLEPGGRLAVISFHSLEDRIVKNAFLDFQNKDFGIIITKKPIVPSSLEIKMNKRSRSAKLRVLEKV